MKAVIVGKVISSAAIENEWAKGYARFVERLKTFLTEKGFKVETTDLIDHLKIAPPGAEIPKLIFFVSKAMRTSAEECAQALPDTKIIVFVGDPSALLFNGNRVIYLFKNPDDFSTLLPHLN